LPWAAPRLDLAAMGRLTFEAPDLVRFPALRLAREALAAGGAAPAVFNAANEVAALAFLDRRLAFLNIAAVIADTLAEAASKGITSIGVDACDAALAVDAEARVVARAVVDRLAMA
jgi:1-deoxy-D-xylulose-5-phosphate reductoisomerase